MYTKKNNFFVVQFYKEQISKQNDFSLKYLLMENLLEKPFTSTRTQTNDVLTHIYLPGYLL